MSKPRNAQRRGQRSPPIVPIAPEPAHRDAQSLVSSRAASLSDCRSSKKSFQGSEPAATLHNFPQSEAVRRSCGNPSRPTQRARWPNCGSSSRPAADRAAKPAPPIKGAAGPIRSQSKPAIVLAMINAAPLARLKMPNAVPRNS